MKFRFHRGGLEESLATVVEFNSKEELQKIIEESLERKLPPIECKFYTYDKRINWNTFIISAEGYGMLGFTDGLLDS